MTEVDVFLADIRDHDCESMIGQLAAEDRARLARISHARRRAQFIIGRRLLDLGLRQRHGHASASWRLAAGAGKPRLLGDGAPEVSLSHARELVLCAIADVPIGLDVEYCRERDFPALVEQMVGTDGRDRYLRLGDDVYGEAFYRIWTLREALFKLQGDWPSGTSWWPDEPDSGEKIVIHTFIRPVAGFMATVAVRGSGPVRIAMNAIVTANLRVD
ncbi:MAG TPA: 4'-phosphopantetheinyl transferase superfamily protein [Burkholderiaceae bacterium]|nr:4'-phosphopantetheinyl transferase superfamily protein [Burkholderiaceae bacterium]